MQYYTVLHCKMFLKNSEVPALLHFYRIMLGPYAKLIPDTLLCQFVKRTEIDFEVLTTCMVIFILYHCACRPNNDQFDWNFVVR